MSGAVERLRDAVRASGTPLASSLDDRPPERGNEATERALLAGAGSRVAAHRDDVEIAVSAVDEGYRLHYAEPRALRIDDPDLRLLAGDRMYALGLARLAAIGDLTAIAELADVISLSAQAHASGDEDLADAAWRAGVSAIAWGPTAAVAEAKSQARAEDRGAAGALRAAADAASRAA
jgi:hypothetical protein